MRIMAIHCFMKHIGYLKILLLFLLPLILHAEGGVEMLKNDCNNFGYLQIWDNNDTTRPFATYNAPQDYRLNIRVNAGDTVYFGFGGTFANGGTAVSDVYARIKDPDGIIAFPAYQLSGGNNTVGYINGCSRMLTGPFANGGYKPFMFRATKSGDYYVEFGINNDTLVKQKRVIPWYDVTVKNGTIKKGRLWSKAWDLTTNGSSNQFKADMYVYSEDSVVTRLDFNGIQPYGFIISCNSFGSTNVGTLLERRKSDYRQNVFDAGGIPGMPEYPIFVNDPDSTHFPSGQIGAVDSLVISGCNWGGNCINVYANKSGQAEVLLTFPNGTDKRYLEEVVRGQNCIWWDGLDGNGSYLNTNDTVHISVKYTTGMTHLPLIDVENHLNGYSVNLVRPNKKIDGTLLPPPAIFWDDDLLSDPGNSLDSNANLIGCTTGGGCHRWQNRGTSNTNPEIINTWWYINLEQTTYTILCPVVLDVELKNFTGHIEKGAAILMWKTSSEQDLELFKIQKSLDGHTFFDIGTENALNKPADYSFIDENLVAHQFYRLQFRTLNGNDSYSQIISLKANTEEPEFTWNPSENTFQIYTLKEEEVEIAIFDLYGRLIHQFSGKTNSSYSLPALNGFIFVTYKTKSQSTPAVQKLLLK